MCLAIPGRILEIEDAETEFRQGKVDFNGVRKQVNLAFLPDAKVGEYVLVHVGIALHKIDEAEAQRTFALLRELDELDEIS
ncbi:MAG: HypC/HybG/HupF family hydrogenase formation chaperone [Acidobacteria bacterium]|nr:HypC/HybG/HupF family hydrogenase formation chaperone [Acidobacteriota bacterium]